ncbi:MAG: sulfurtransferase TusA [Rhodospirillales bacterium]
MKAAPAPAAPAAPALPREDHVLDASGLKCPLPVLKTRKRLKDIADGETLLVLATDPASFVDIPHFCNVSGHTLLDWREEDGTFRYLIRKTL